MHLVVLDAWHRVFVVRMRPPARSHDSEFLTHAPRVPPVYLQPVWLVSSRAWPQRPEPIADERLIRSSAHAVCQLCSQLEAVFHHKPTKRESRARAATAEHRGRRGRRTCTLQVRSVSCPCNILPRCNQMQLDAPPLCPCHRYSLSNTSPHLLTPIQVARDARQLNASPT